MQLITGSVWRNKRTDKQVTIERIGQVPTLTVKSVIDLFPEFLIHFRRENGKSGFMPSSEFIFHFYQVGGLWPVKCLA